MKMTGGQRAAVLAVLGVVVLAGTGTAVAGGMITGKDVKDSSITGKDVKNGSLTKDDLDGGALGDLQGPAGAAGAPGAAGPSGAPGTSGTSGPTGAPGTSGTSGTSGPTGAPGTSGTSGTNGPPGTSGTSGTSGASGAPGSPGPSGPSGPAGPSGPGAVQLVYSKTATDAGTDLATVGPLTYRAECSIGAFAELTLKVTGAPSHDYTGLLVSQTNGAGATAPHPLNTVGGSLAFAFNTTGTSGPNQPVRYYASPLLVTWSGGTQSVELVATAISSASGVGSCTIKGTVTPAS